MSSRSTRSLRHRLIGPGILLLAGGLVFTVSVVLSKESLTERVAVDARVFDQEPRNMRLRAGAWEIGLGGDRPELDALRDWAVKRGLALRRPGEIDLDVALRTARFVQDTLKFGGAGASPFRGWTPRHMIAQIEAGEGFFCDSYARLLVALLVAQGIPARAVWMDGHVTSEVWGALRHHRWILVDAMFNMTVTGDGEPLSIMRMRDRLERGLPVEVVPISDPSTVDEPSRAAITGDTLALFRRGMFAVVDSEVEFESASQHLLLPVMSLATPEMPEGTPAIVRFMRWVAPAFLAVGALMVGAARGTPFQA